jgi:hypothetical protein
VYVAHHQHNCIKFYGRHNNQSSYCETIDLSSCVDGEPLIQMLVVTREGSIPILY